MLPTSTIIISVYKDTVALEIILESLRHQTTLPNEVIISEDGDSIEMANFVANQTQGQFKITHLSQPDIGWQKNTALNKAIKAASNEYLIFIDGDCVPYSTFVHAHLTQAMQGIVLCGKRIELGPNFSERVRHQTLNVRDIERKFIRFLPALLKDKARHIEDGFHIKPQTILSGFIHKRHVRHLIGCNFSCYKNDFLKINGFDETYRLPSVGEDVDPSSRFRGVGIVLKSCRQNANVAHLYHKKCFSSKELKINEAIMQSHLANGVFYCENGIEKGKPL